MEKTNPKEQQRRSSWRTTRVYLLLKPREEKEFLLLIFLGAEISLFCFGCAPRHVGS